MADSERVRKKFVKHIVSSKALPTAPRMSSIAAMSSGMRNIYTFDLVKRCFTAISITSRIS